MILTDGLVNKLLSVCLSEWEDERERGPPARPTNLTDNYRRDESAFCVYTKKKGGAALLRSCCHLPHTRTGTGGRETGLKQRQVQLVVGRKKKTRNG